VVRVQENRTVHLAGQSDRLDLSGIHVRRDFGDRGFGRIPPVFRILFDPSHFRTVNGVFSRGCRDDGAIVIDE
jgi:hypothetical protein